MTPKKIRAVVLIVSQVASAVSLRSKLREARRDNDKLALADVAVTALGLITGTALAVRSLRKGEES